MSNRELIDFAYREWRGRLDDPAFASPTSFEAGYKAARSAPIPQDEAARIVASFLEIRSEADAWYESAPGFGPAGYAHRINNAVHRAKTALERIAATQPAEQTTINDAGGVEGHADDPKTGSVSADPSAYETEPRNNPWATRRASESCSEAREGLHRGAKSDDPKLEPVRAGIEPGPASPSAQPAVPDHRGDGTTQEQRLAEVYPDHRDAEIARYKEALRKYVIDSVDTDIGRIVRCLECVQIWGDGKPENHTPSCLARGNAP